MWLVMGALEGKRFARPLAETLGRMQNSTVWLHQLYRGTGKVLKSLIGTGPGLKGVHIPTMRHSSVGKVEPLKRERPAKGGVPTNKLTSHQQDGLSCCVYGTVDSFVTSGVVTVGMVLLLGHNLAMPRSTVSSPHACV